MQSALMRVGVGVHGDFVLPRNDLILRQILEYGGHTRPEVAFLTSVVRPGDTILDIGAHVGTFAVPMARHAGPAGLVCAFEPTPETYELLVLNVELNGLADVIWPVQAPVSDRNEVLAVERRNLKNTGANRMASDDDGQEAVTVDTWVAEHLSGRPIDIVKIDVEGMEARVLAGARDTLRKYRPCMYFEVNAEHYAHYGSTTDDLRDILDGSVLLTNTGERNASNDDFEATRIDDLMEHGDHFDVLAIPEERLDRIELS